MENQLEDLRKYSLFQLTSLKARLNVIFEPSWMLKAAAAEAQMAWVKMYPH